jgi:RHS repeat-associated protein
VPATPLASGTRYENDAFGRLATLRALVVAGETLSGTEIQTTRYQYDLEGRLVRQTNPNGTIALHTYDTLGRLTKLTHYAPDSTPEDLSNNAELAEFDDEHNVAGQRTSTMETFWFDDAAHTSEIDWTYDSAGRLVDEVFNHYDDTLDQSQHFAYDLSGNRLSRSLDEGLNNSVDRFFAYEYDANDRLREETESQAGTLVAMTERTYRQTQELLRTKSNGVGTVVEQWSYDFDARGYLLEATGTRPGEATSLVSYLYDDSGIRYRSVTSTANPATGVFSVEADTNWLNDNANFTGHEQAIRETVKNAAGETIRSRDYTFGLSLISQSTKNAGNATFEALTFHADALGSTRALSDETGSLGTSSSLRVFSYTAGGEAAGFDPDTAPTAILYTQQPWDASLGLQYNRARYLDLATGRFLGLDPYAGDALNPQSYNRYLYVTGDPVNLVDPTGWVGVPGSVFTAVGPRVHKLFSVFAALRGRSWLAGKSLGTILPAEFPEGTEGRSLKPDLVDTTRQEYFDLKAVSYRDDVTRAKALDKQLLKYDNALRPLGYARGDSSDLIFHQAVYPVGVVQHAGLKYLVSFEVLVGARTTASGSRGPGMVFYDLDLIPERRDKDDPEGPKLREIPQQLDLSVEDRRNIEVYDNPGFDSQGGYGFGDYFVLSTFIGAFFAATIIRYRTFGAIYAMANFTSQATVISINSMTSIGALNATMGKAA